MKPISIAFIGGGNMAQALIGGLCRAGRSPDSIVVSEPAEAVRQTIVAEFATRVTADNREAAAHADVVVLAVKPQIMDAVLSELTPLIAPDVLVISVAAGVTLTMLQHGLGDRVRLVRAMPNTPALFGVGMTGLVASPAVDEQDRQRAAEILGSAGETVWLDDEALMDVVTAVSGSGPAYFFALAEQLALAGERAGLPPAVAAQLARQTAYGAGIMLARSGRSAGELRGQVTSPGGTTEAALDSLTRGQFERLVDEAVQAAARRGRELGGN